ncbi:hypothetical protein FRB90_009859, partial [Tulasnella sp. 427]
GEFPVLVNCAILTEGADVPNIDCVMIARPTRSRNLFAQIIGRGMRLSPNTGKTDCRIIDFVDSLNRVGGIVNEDPSQIIEDINTGLQIGEEDTSKSPTRRITSPVPDPEYVTYIEHDDPFSLVANATGSPHLKALSPNAWIQCGPTVWVLECLGKGFIKIERLSDQDRDPDSEDRPQPEFAAHFAPTIAPAPWLKGKKGSPYAKKRKVMTADTLGEAIKGCDSYAMNKVGLGPMAIGLLRNAAWRRTPATEAQKKFLKQRYKGRFTEDDDTDGVSLEKALTSVRKPSAFDPKALTKGDAANMINRLKHGAQTYYLRRLKVEQRASQKAENERRKLEGRNVRIGPPPAAS